MLELVIILIVCITSKLCVHAYNILIVEINLFTFSFILSANIWSKFWIERRYIGIGIKPPTRINCKAYFRKITNFK